MCNLRKSVKFTDIKSPNKVIRSSLMSRNIYVKQEYSQKFGIHQIDNILYVYFRGCNSKQDLVSGMDIRKANIFGENIYVHNGFYQQYLDLETSLYSELYNTYTLNNVKDIIFTGHSAGGSIAQIASVVAKSWIWRDKNINIHCIVFGTPKVGNNDFKDIIEYELQDRLLRVETYNDIVCLLPMHISFHHAGSALILKNGVPFNCDGSDDSFFANYYTDYVTLVNDMRRARLIDRKSIDDMIDGHYSENYVQNIKVMLKNYLIQ